MPSLPPSSWTLIYCVSGAGAFAWEGGEIPFQSGQVTVFPPQTAYTLVSPTKYRGLMILMASPMLPFKHPAVLQDDSRGSIRMAFESALYHFQTEEPQSANLLSAFGSLIVCYLAAYQSQPPYSQVVIAIQQDILRHFADPSYALDSFMKTLPFNYDYLRKLFQREVGMTPHQLLNSVRLKTAADALLNAEASGPSISDICRLCGFREPLYFSRMFKKKFGVSPSFYARKQREETDAIVHSEEDCGDKVKSGK